MTSVISFVSCRVWFWSRDGCVAIRARVITELTLDELSYHAVYRVSLLEGVTFEVVVNISLNRKHVLLASGLARVLPVPLPRLGVFRFHGNPLPRPSAVRLRVVKKNVTR